MKNSTQYLMLAILGISCDITYIVLVCVRGVLLSDFIIMSTSVFILLLINYIPDFLKLRRLEKEEEIRNPIQELQDSEIGYPQVNEYEIVIDNEEEE